MKNPAADQLNIEMPHFQNALAGFAHGGEGFWKQVIQSFAIRQPLLELAGFPHEFAVGQLGEGRFQV